MVVRGTGPDDPDDGVPLCLQINAEGLVHQTQNRDQIWDNSASRTWIDVVYREQTHFVTIMGRELDPEPQILLP